MTISHWLRRISFNIFDSKRIFRFLIALRSEKYYKLTFILFVLMVYSDVILVTSVGTFFVDKNILWIVSGTLSKVYHRFDVEMPEFNIWFLICGLYTYLIFTLFYVFWVEINHDCVNLIKELMF